MTEQRMDSAANQVRSILAGIVSRRVSGPKDYQQVLARMVRPADNVLNRALKKLDIQAEPLDKAMEKLAAAARIEGICYPWGSHGLYELSREVRVTLRPKAPITLREALAQITRQAFGPAAATSSPASQPASRPGGPPRLKWAMCRGFNDVLFPLGGDIEMFPLKIGDTPVMTRQELQGHEMLANCATAARGGSSLTDVAFQAREFLGKAPGRSTAIEVGKDGPRMVLTGPRRGRLIWRPLKAVAAHRPEKITPELRKQIVSDLRTRAAYDLAAARAKKIRAIAAEKGLAAAAKELKLETSESEMFARKGRFSPRQQLLQYAAYTRRISIQLFVQMAAMRPVVYMWDKAGDIELPTNEHSEHFMERAFSLAPDDINKPIAPGAKPAVVIFPLPAKRQVFVLERIGYEPAVVGDFDKEGRQQIARDQLQLQRWQSMQRWFNLSGAKARTGFMLKAQ